MIGAIIGGGLGLLGSLFGASAANKQARAAERMHQAQLANAKRWEHKMLPYMAMNDRMIYNPETTSLYNNIMGGSEQSSNQTLRQLASLFGGRGYNGAVESGATAEAMGNANRDIFNNAAMSITGAQNDAQNQNMGISNSLMSMYAGMGHDAGMNAVPFAGGSDGVWSNLLSGAGGGMMNYAFGKMADNDRMKQVSTLLDRYKGDTSGQIGSPGYLGPNWPPKSADFSGANGDFGLDFNKYNFGRTNYQNLSNLFGK